MTREELQTEWLKAYCPTCANNDDGWADDLACMISDYITDLFIAKRGEQDG